MKVMQKIYYLAYCRKSSESEDRQLQSIDDQLQVLKELASKRNIQILEYFTESKSAKQPYVRQEFQRLIDTIHKRKDIKGIVCWNLNRLSRNPVDSGTIQWLLQNGDIEEIVTPSKIYLEIDSDIIMSVENAMSNKFIRDLRKDTMRGTNAKISKGLAPLQAPPGYQNNTFKPQGQRDISPSQYFPLMRKVFSMALTGRFSISKLRDYSEEIGVQNRYNRPISKTQMFETLKNPFYTGQFRYAGDIHEGTHQPLISQAEFDLLQDIYKLRPERYQTHQFSLTGLIQCLCGGWVTAEQHIKPSGKRYVYYKCSRKGKGCDSSMISEPELSNQVISFLSTIALKQHYIDWFVRWLNFTNKEKVQLRDTQSKTLEMNVHNTQIQLDNLLSMKLSPHNIDGSMIDDESYKRQRVKLLNQKHLSQEQLNNTDKHFEDFDDLTVRTFNFAVSAIDKFKNGNILEKKIVVQAVGSNLILNNSGRLDIKPRTPFKLIQDRIIAVKRIEPSTRLSDSPTPLLHSVLYPVPDSNRRFSG